ncbi:diguanylate cyclase domain-containing protein [Propionivibrio dicarboxylicus]|uniref:diguanylate cyclase n=1 Tax=Propionivibrio dicarboxylicus TaxID=83767 RepID=A0A1G8JEI8_9RHOO|nr:diguanylate cyclase [Propionivibrio dicarboxylicus]SDI29461.1 two-component system, cell cycle response regulator [Propionivibrio dicarboxylicus]
MRALIVDPSRMIRNVFAALFAKNNVRAIGVTTASKALDELARAPVDFLCFAMQLPDMTGLEFYAHAKANDLIGQHPSVLLTGSQEGIGAQALALGVTECFSKNEPAVFEDFVTHWATTATSKLRGRVLVVEDSAMQAAHFERLLDGFGLSTAHAASGEAALALIGQDRCDLALIDYVLEGSMTGLAVIRQIRALPGRAGKIPLLAISSFDDTARRIEMLRSGANDFVAKPVVAEELQVRVGNLIQWRQALDFLEEQQQTLYDMAMRDRLTSLYNRYYINEHTQSLIKAAHASGRPLCLAVLDIDHFKRINDAHGHAMGDMVLVAVASALTESLDENAVAARIGGEEFMLVLKDCDTFAATRQGEKLLEMLEELSPSGLRVTASLGIAQCRPGDSYDSLLNRADLAMYEAKRNGRNCVISAD